MVIWGVINKKRSKILDESADQRSDLNHCVKEKL